MQKIQFKTFSNVSLDAYLFKNFKFYDLHAQGYLSKADFFRAIAKCGVVVETHVSYSSLRMLIPFTGHTPLKMGMFITSSSLSTSYSKILLPSAKAELIANLKKENWNKASETHKKKRNHFSNPGLISSIDAKHTLKF